MTSSLLKAIKKYKKHSKSYIDTLGFATKYLDAIEKDYGLKEKQKEHIETEIEQKLKKESEKVLKMIKKALKLIDKDEKEPKKQES